MAHAEEKLPAVNAAFIQRTFLGPTTANMFKGMIWGNAAAISQALGTSYYELAASSKAAGKAIDIAEFKKLSWSKMTVFWPSLVAHTAIFAAYRGSLEMGTPGRDNTGILAGVQPLLLVSLPTIGYAAMYRTMPPQFLRFGVISAALLHVYDRCWHPKGLNVDTMPTAKLNRRVW